MVAKDKKLCLRKNSVKVASNRSDHRCSVGIMTEAILEGMAEHYPVDLSEKVVCGIPNNALKYVFNCGTKPIGYIIDKEQHFQIDYVTSPSFLPPLKNTPMVQQ